MKVVNNKVPEKTTTQRVTNAQELDIRMAQVRAAQKKYSTFTQKQVDQIFKAAAIAANDQRIPLAKIAVEETGMGLVEDKVIKNHFASEYIYNCYKDSQTVGVFENDEAGGISKIYEPIGVLAAVVPTTNPTSTGIFKALIALKTRNGIVFSPHPGAKKCTIAAIKVVRDAAVAAGAPKDIIAWVDEPSIELSGLVMKSADLILATGGPGMVQAAYSSGKPAVGVGSGNTPAIIDDTADIKMAVSSILLSKNFDYGTICASEQTVIVMESIYDEVRKEFIKRGAYFLTPDETEKIRKVILVDGRLNPKQVGRSASTIAALGGIKLPEETKVLIGEIESVELEEEFSHEKLSTVLGMYKVKTFEEALAKAERLVVLGGYGHSSVLWTHRTKSKDRIAKFSSLMRTGRIMINMPSSQGGIGDIFNFKTTPSLTLGCGSWGGNSVSENVGIKQLLNIKNLAQRRENMLWFKVPSRVYFKYGCIEKAIQELKVLGKKKVFIVTDQILVDLGIVHRATRVLTELGIEFKVFSDVLPDPTLATARAGVEQLNGFKPDTIMSIGGGSPIDAAKIMWVLYEHPEVKFEDLAMRFMDIRKRVYTFPVMGSKCYMVAVPTTAGTGSEVTPFAVITDEKTGAKYPLADYELLPNMAIIDAELMINMPRGLTAASGIDALTHGLESYVSVMASPFTDGLALEAIKEIFKNLPLAYNEGQTNIKAREGMAHASAMAGMAFGNAFLGVCHSMAHKLGSKHHVPHGVANALLINEVIKYNAVDNPRKQGTFPQYEYPNAKRKYAMVSEALNLGGKTDDEKVDLLIKAIQALKDQVNIPKSISAAGVKKEDFYETLDEMCELAFDDQCTGANPRYPLIKEIKAMYIKVFE
ncbi:MULTISPECIES: bifunctional acetaldehyde-CoA/alcohol dehydrogenase [Clostridium]|uniref:Aldehyde-alcohol dehydrogenase n=1 Tax=Clostridium frigoriphilum TaxID=443253 RepID=A0ABU7UUI8_9CLOT|nr:bifunctional acetaldehyde-CoA/alcohol dehydrogenase [Clostridium sp. DSM 17811]MBU3101062.1 bifunctional acetaldehyde-CoA/alcohol dehydrogenase [Clostridium sp. DSM 17811]